MFTVIPSGATSLDSVLAQPTWDARIALEIPRLGMGWTIPELETTRMRPHLRFRIPGRKVFTMESWLMNIA